MDEFDKYYGDEFFIIDSNNINSISSKLYGFAICDGEIVQNQHLPHNFNFLDYGVFVNVDVTDDEIIVSQDFNGSYGIYLFKQDDYFAISNSFWKLVEHIQGNYQLSVNEEFTKSVFLRENFYAFSYKDTFVNEIEIIPRSIAFHINKNNASFSFEKIDYEEASVELDSKEGLELLDTWFNKWINILRSIKEKTNNISFDLSGGSSSRIILSILLNSHIDLENVAIYSLTDSIDNHDNDLRIAEEIAEEFNLNLNPYFSQEKVFFNELDTIINSSAYVKLGFNNKFFYNFSRFKDTLFSFNGRGGNILKGLPSFSLDEYIEDIVFSSKQNIFFIDSSKNLLKKDLDNIKEIFNEDDDWIVWRHYKETISRNYYGKDAVEEYFANKFSLSPFFDPILNKLKLTTNESSDRNLLIGVIFSRYCPKLLDFEFEGKNFDYKTLDYANSINEILPYNAPDYELIQGSKTDLKIASHDENDNMEDLKNYLKKVFFSDEFKTKFVNIFNSQIYYEITEGIQTSEYCPMNFFSPSFSLVKIHDDSEKINFNYSTISEWIDHYYEDNDDNILLQFVKSNLSKYVTARIDMKNYGNSLNDIEILEYSDEYLNIYKNWGKNDDGNGIHIQSQNMPLYLKLKCINDGILKFNLRGMYIPDINNVNLPIYIDFREFTVNGKNLLESSKLVSMDDKYLLGIDVKDGDILDLKIKWLPCNKFSDSENINQSFKKLKERYENLRDIKGKRRLESEAIRASRRAVRDVKRALRAAARDAARDEDEAAQHANFIEDNPLRNFPVSDEVIIEVDDISMEFVLAEEKVDNFKEYVIRLLKRELPEKTKFKALNHVSFKVHKGERLGIIGFNGAGKSTLLKILSGVMKPTEGKVTVKGGVAPLLELGAGFDINYTGEENIFLNGSILGYQREFLEEKFDEIVEFSELGHFIKVPIKNYSSGMKAKLGFSVATIVNPDILILDEVLSVGDVKFKQKSKEKLEELMGDGVTVIMVTHSVNAIRKMCNKVIWLDKGNLIRYGDVDEICDEYIDFAENGTEEDLKNIKLH